MSNSHYSWMPAEKAAAFDQFSKCMEMVCEGQRSPEEIRHALQALIRGDSITVTPKVAVTPTGKIFHVTGNARSAKEAINALNCPVRWGMAREPSEIPLVIQPVDCQVRAVPLSRFTQPWEIFGLFPKIVDPMTLLAFGAKFPEEQCKAEHFTTWLDTLGRLWFVIINVFRNERYVNVDNHLDWGWRKGCCVLTRE